MLKIVEAGRGKGLREFSIFFAQYFVNLGCFHKQSLLIFFLINFFEVKLTYKAVLISSVQQRLLHM